MNPEPTLMWRSDCDKSISVRCESIVIWCNGVFCTVISPTLGRGAAGIQQVLPKTAESSNRYDLSTPRPPKHVAV